MKKKSVTKDEICMARPVCQNVVAMTMPIDAEKQLTHQSFDEGRMNSY